MPSNQKKKNTNDDEEEEVHDRTNKKNIKSKRLRTVERSVLAGFMKLHIYKLHLFDSVRRPLCTVLCIQKTKAEQRYSATPFHCVTVQSSDDKLINVGHIRAHRVYT